MTRATLLALAERVEAATGADRALAKDIYRALFDAPELGHPNGYGWREDDSGWWLATGEDARTPPKTIYPPKWLTSLDAAMSLVPSGLILRNYQSSRFVPHSCEVALSWAHGGWLGNSDHSFALALTAACLRARAIAGSMTDD